VDRPKATESPRGPIFAEGFEPREGNKGIQFERGFQKDRYGAQLIYKALERRKETKINELV